MRLTLRNNRGARFKKTRTRPRRRAKLRRGRTLVEVWRWRAFRGLLFPASRPRDAGSRDLARRRPSGRYLDHTEGLLRAAIAGKPDALSYMGDQVIRGIGDVERPA